MCGGNSAELAAGVGAGDGVTRGGATLGTQAAAMKMRMSVGNYMGNSMAMGPGFSGGKTPQEAGITSPAQVPAQMQA